jgi:hypothetical protein
VYLDLVNEVFTLSKPQNEDEKTCPSVKGRREHIREILKSADFPPTFDNCYCSPVHVITELHCS